METALVDLAIFQADKLLSLMIFGISSLWTPGPNNIMLANSGATFGHRATLPHAMGVALGFPLMLFFVALGLGELFQQSALLRETLKWVGAGLMFYLAWRIANAGRAKAAAQAKPFSFAQAVGFQWINPKAWTMAIGASSVFVLGQAPLIEAAVCGVVFTLLGLGSSQTWTAFGVAIRRYLSSDARLRAFNIVMGVLVAASATAIMIDF